MLQKSTTVIAHLNDYNDEKFMLDANCAFQVSLHADSLICRVYTCDAVTALNAKKSLKLIVRVISKEALLSFLFSSRTCHIFMFLPAFCQFPIFSLAFLSWSTPISVLECGPLLKA